MNDQNLEKFIIGFLVGYIFAQQGDQSNALIIDPLNKIKLMQCAFDRLESSDVTPKSDEDYNIELELLVAALSGAIKRQGICHANPATKATEMLFRLIQESDIQPDDYMQQIWADCSGQEEQFDMTLRKIGHVLGWGSSKHAMRHITADDDINNQIITIILYIIMCHPDDFISALRLARQVPHNQKIISALTGGSLAMRLGLEGVPQNWIQDLKSQINISNFIESLNEQ